MALSNEEKDKIIRLWIDQKLKTKSGKKMLKESFGGDKEKYFQFFKFAVARVEAIVNEEE